MIPKSTAKGRWSLALTGRFAQFNLSLLLVFTSLITIFIISLHSTNLILLYGGSIISILLVTIFVIFVIIYYNKQETRPAEGQMSLLEIQNGDGNKFTIRNPPDSFFAKDQARALMRAMLLGYDEGLCPDGKVIGDVAKEQYQLYTEEEKKKFVAEHKTQIGGKKQHIEHLLTEGDATDKTGE